MKISLLCLRQYIFCHYPYTRQTQKGGFSRTKTRYNRFKNYLSDTCLRARLFATRGEFQPISPFYPLWRKHDKTIENALVSNFEQISGVSVIRRGVHLKINIIEAKLKDKSNKNLISPVNGIIISASATSGNLKVKAGDFILKDSVLVSQDNNKEICATLTIRAFYSDSLIYDQNQISYKKTGKTKNQTTLTLFGKSFKPSQNINFNFYQCIKYNRYVFFNLFLPLKIQTTCYQELKQVVEVIPFEQSEKTLKNNLETKIKKSLPKNADIKNTTFTTFKEGSKTRLDCYVETYLTIST